MPQLTSVLTDAETLREKIHSKTVAALTSVFPLDLKGRTLEVKDVKVHDRTYSSDEQKKALLGGDSLQNAVRGTLVLKGADGRVIDEAKNFTLVHVPYLTARHTIIANGNEYQFANQIRRKPGVYTQRADNNELRTIFNLGKGKNFDVGFNEEKGTFSLQYGTSNIPMYAVLRGMGVTHDQIAHHLGEGVAAANQKAHGHQVERSIANLYQKLEHPALYDAKLIHTAKVDAVQKRYGMTTLDPEVTAHTLGKPHDKVTPTAMLDAAKKILAVHQGKTLVDDTDSLTFKTFHSVDDFLAERIKLTARAWAPKAKMALSGKSVIRDALRPAPFSDAIRKFVTTSSLTAVPSGINPLELLDHAVKVTALGEGGITSDRAIPLDARMTHATHFGALDPIRTPESNHAGVDVRATISAHRDDHGNLYTTVHDVKAGKRAFMKAGDLLNHVVAFPNQDRKKPVKAFVNGTVQDVAWSKVTHQMEHMSHQYSPATSLIPMIHNIQGNRAIMGSKMGTQALPLLEREVPYVQVKSHLPGEVSFESIYGHMTVPTSPVHGTVEKIQDGYVWIRPHGEKTAEDRPVIEQKKLGPHTFNIEIKKDHLVPGNKYPSTSDYGHLPGYTGPDGDSLDFFVGNHPHGVLAVIDKQKNFDGKGWVTTDKKFCVGMDPKEYAAWREHPAMSSHPSIRYANDKHFKDWDHLQSHIDEHFKNEKTAGFGTVWANHAALNAGLAARDARYLLDYPGADGKWESAKKRIPRLAEDVVFGVLPPQWTHGDEDLSEMDGELKLKARALHGYAPWDHPDPSKTAAAKDDHGLIKVPYETNFPFPSKTYLHHDIQVKPGQTVQAGQRLGDSNYTRNGTLALGKNLLVGYMPYHGMNSNDAVVISEGCAGKLTSEHMYRETYPLSSQIELSAEKHKVYYGNKVTPQQYAKLDSTGVVKVGAKVDSKDPLILGLTKTQIQGVDLMLGRISKSLTKPYREVNLNWEHGSQGTVVEVFRNASQISILVKTQERMNVGDKLAGRYGNKGVVAKIIPDHEMIQDEKGRPLDLILTSASVISRINPAQIIETAVGKVVEKTGKPILYDNAENKNAVLWAKNLLKEHGIKDKEHVYDPIQKRKILGGDGKGVLVGRQFIYKLFKSTDTNFSGHGVGPYDVNEQPLKTGGEESAKGIGKMEFDSLIAHGARNLLQESATVRGTKSDEFWRAVQLGAPLPAPKPSFAFNKFTAMLEGSGIRVDKRGSKFKLLPMTDKGVLEKSRGAIENKKTLIAKNLKPETGGLFDPAKTGGPQGSLYSHIDLHESIPHPVFVEPVRRLLGLSQKEFEQKIHDEGGNWFHKQLKGIDVDKKIVDLRKHMITAQGPDLDNTVKQLKYLQALKEEKLAPHEAYMMSKVPVIPPVFRPILPEKRDPSQLMVADANKLYAHLMDTNNVLKTTALESDRGKHRQMVFHAVGAVFGMHEPDDDKLKKQEVKGFLQNIAGVGTPKGGFFQRKLMRRTQDTSGRGTAVPDVNLGMDEVGMPEQMLWQMLDTVILARLVRQGYGALEARELVDKKAPVAHAAMLAETKSRPVLINRAPTLHRWSIIAANPVPVQGKTIRVNPFIEKGMNLDYDGDTLQVHVPIQLGAVEDAKKMTMSQMLLSDQQHNKLMAFPQHEAIMGFTLASQAKTTAGGPAHHFHTRAEALAAWRAGKLKLTDSITVDSEKRASLEQPHHEDASLGEKDVLFFYPAENVTGYGF
jgi:DNA-directed RNA polymerase beta subunit